MFGGGVYLSCSAFRANMSVPCSSCGGGCLGSRADCTCQFDAGSEHVMLVARVTLGDAHVCTEYDADAYRGPPVSARPQLENVKRAARRPSRARLDARAAMVV
eukprot:3518987-Rhodomonas_salina.1